MLAISILDNSDIYSSSIARPLEQSPPSSSSLSHLRGKYHASASSTLGPAVKWPRTRNTTRIRRLEIPSLYLRPRFALRCTRISHCFKPRGRYSRTLTPAVILRNAQPERPHQHSQQRCSDHQRPEVPSTIRGSVLLPVGGADTLHPIGRSIALDLTLCAELLRTS